MFRRWMAFVSIVSLMMSVSACGLQTEGSAPRQQNAVRLVIKLQSLDFPIHQIDKPIPDPKLPLPLQHIQLFFNGVKPFYPKHLGQTVPDSEKEGAIAGLIDQVSPSIGKQGKKEKPKSEKSIDSFFNASKQEQKLLEKGSSWSRISTDIQEKTAHLEKAQEYSINKDFDGYLQTIIDELQTASDTKNYKLYGEASKNILLLNKAIFAVVHQ